MNYPKLLTNINKIGSHVADRRHYSACFSIEAVNAELNGFGVTTGAMVDGCRAFTRRVD